MWEGRASRREVEMGVIGDRRRDRNESEEESGLTLSGPLSLTSWFTARKGVRGGRDDVKPAADVGGHGPSICSGSAVFQPPSGLA